MIDNFGGEPTICDILQFTIRRRTNIYEGGEIKYQAGDPGWGQEKTHNFF